MQARGLVKRYGPKAALDGVETLMLVSSSEVGQRFAQHKNVIESAKNAGVSRIVYTSLLKADTAKMALADEHRATEELLKNSGLAITAADGVAVLIAAGTNAPIPIAANATPANQPGNICRSSSGTASWALSTWIFAAIAMKPSRARRPRNHESKMSAP